MVEHPCGRAASHHRATAQHGRFVGELAYDGKVMADEPPAQGKAAQGADESPNGMTSAGFACRWCHICNELTPLISWPLDPARVFS